MADGSKGFIHGNRKGIYEHWLVLIGLDYL